MKLTFPISGQHFDQVDSADHSNFMRALFQKDFAMGYVRYSGDIQ